MDMYQKRNMRKQKKESDDNTEVSVKNKINW